MDADIIESTAGELAAELARRGIDPSRRVVTAVEPDDWLSRGHAAWHPLVEAAGLTDAQLDLLIKEGRRAANEAMRLGDAPA
jgi:hypothetical protein